MARGNRSQWQRMSDDADNIFNSFSPAVHFILILLFRLHESCSIYIFFFTTSLSLVLTIPAPFICLYCTFFMSLKRFPRFSPRTKMPLHKPSVCLLVDNNLPYFCIFHNFSPLPSGILFPKIGVFVLGEFNLCPLL